VSAATTAGAQALAFSPSPIRGVANTTLRLAPRCVREIPTSGSGFDKIAVDEALIRRYPAAALANRHQFRARGKGKHFTLYKRIMKNDFRPTKQFSAAHGNQVGGARPRTDQIDLSHQANSVR
jgi:hypothetical protein